MTNRTPALRSSILLITRMITDRIGLHSVLLPLLIVAKVHREIVSVNFNRKNLTVSRIKMGKNLTASPKSHHWPLRPSINGSFGMSFCVQ